MKNKYFVLFEDCRIVEGYTNVIVYDLTRPHNSNLIPKSLIPFIEKCKELPYEDVINSYDSEEERQIAQEYIDFLIEREFGFLADEHVKNQMGAIQWGYDSPSSVENAIVCYDDSLTTNPQLILGQLDDLLCTNIEFRCRIKSEENFNALCENLVDCVFEAITFRIDYEEYLTLEKWEKLMDANPRIKQAFIYNSPSKVHGEEILFLTSKADYYKDCGSISKNSFTINHSFFNEAQLCNTCLHRKVSIDFDGKIKNCPSMKKHHGNIKDTAISHVIGQKTFQDSWFTKKDEIDVCKDCEFRYMCLDCRAFTDDSSNKYSRPSKCGYNPYIGKWKGEEGYQPISLTTPEQS